MVILCGRCEYKTLVHRIGAAVVIHAPRVPAVYSRLIKNPLCTVLYEDTSLSPNDWENVKIIQWLISMSMYRYL